MLPVLTKLQIDKISIAPDRPLLISDVDEVIVHFVRDFEDFLGSKGLRFAVSGFHLTGDSVTAADGTTLSQDQTLGLVSQFFDERTEFMSPIESAVSSLVAMADVAQVVLLTNLPIEAGDARRRNMKALGLPFPVITNTGPKGPAIRLLASKTRQPVAFVDDSPGFLKSSFEYAPHVTTVHFLQDERFLPHAPDLEFLGLRSNNWTETGAFLKLKLNGKQP